MSPNRRNQILLMAGCLGFSWLAMQAVHEFGHVLVAWLSGGRVQHVVLHPLTISRTDVSPNPNPLAVTWGGPIIGSVAPLLLLLVLQRMKRPYLLTFFAGFCLIANGLYLGVGWIDRVGDAGDLLRHGAAVWQLVLFGAATVPAGLWIWHRGAPDFGFGRQPQPIDLRSVQIIWMALLMLLSAMFLFG